MLRRFLAVFEPFILMLLGTVLLVNATSIALRVYLRSRKKW